MAKLAILIAIIAFACICEAVPVAGGFNFGGSGNNNPFENPWSLLDPANVPNMKPNGGQMNAVYTSTSSRNKNGVPVAGGFNFGGSGNNNPFRNPWSLLNPASVANMKPNGGRMNAVYSSHFSGNDNGKIRREGVILMNDNGKVNGLQYGTP